jgi:hypothetical protein
MVEEEFGKKTKKQKTKKHFWKNHTHSDGKQLLNGDNPTSVFLILSYIFTKSGILLYLIDSI